MEYDDGETHELRRKYDSEVKAIVIIATVGVGIAGFFVGFSELGLGWVKSAGCGLAGAVLGWLLACACYAIACDVIR